MPPSLSVSVGVPPATVTASLRFSVSVTVLPASRSPLEGDSTSDEMVGVVVSTVTVMDAELALTFPALSVSVAVKV